VSWAQFVIDVVMLAPPVLVLLVVGVIVFIGVQREW